MASRNLQLTFPENQVLEPVIYQIIKKFDVVPCIRRANISNHVGFMVMEVTGDEKAIDDAVAYLKGLNVEVSSPQGDIVAG
jgi:ABC-type methionine transport system ATPase subunit